MLGILKVVFFFSVPPTELSSLNNRVKTGLSLRSGSWCLEISPGYFCRKQSENRTKTTS